MFKYKSSMWCPAAVGGARSSSIPAAGLEAPEGPRRESLHSLASRCFGHSVNDLGDARHTLFLQLPSRCTDSSLTNQN